MKRLLLPLLAALALPTAAQEFIEIKPEYIYSYDKTSIGSFVDRSSWAILGHGISLGTVYRIMRMIPRANQQK